MILFFFSFELNVINMLILGVGVLQLPLLIDLLRVLFPGAGFERLSQRWMSRMLIAVVSALLASSMYYFFGTYLPLLVCPVVEVASPSGEAASLSHLSCSLFSLAERAQRSLLGHTTTVAEGDAMPALWTALALSVFAVYLWYATTASYYYAVNSHAGRLPDAVAAAAASPAELDVDLPVGIPPTDATHANPASVPAQLEQLRTCLRCEGAPVKPPSTRHCTKCEQCVYMFDHHWCALLVVAGVAGSVGLCGWLWVVP
jgi:hypothetical protein